MKQLTLEGGTQDVTPRKFTPEQLLEALKTDYDYNLHSNGQDRTGYTIEPLAVTHIKEWGREWFTVWNTETNESITTTNVIDATRLLNEMIAEI
jgi:hypothetical protein